MRTTRILLTLAAAATLAACSDNAASPVDPGSATVLRDGTGYLGTGNKDGSAGGDSLTVTQRGVGYLGTGN
ncbi:MAG: hypothetical protein ABW277_01395 [Longimicrobiaceae bacterium]